MLLSLLLTSGYATAATPNSRLCNLNEKEAAGLSGDLGTDVLAAREYEGTIRGMLKEKQFKKLDCLADHVRSSKERFPGGMWKLKQLYAGLDEPVQPPMHATQEDWKTLLHSLQGWVTARPKSITARVALGSAYFGYATYARGDGYADTVSESGWKLFGERIATARRILNKAAALPTKDPEWYVAMLLIAENQDWDAAKKRALFEDAFKFEPDYYYYDRVWASHLLPKWGGKPGDTEKFVEEVADRVGGDQGDILYFQAASADYVICACEDDPHLSWERIQRGFAASEKQYGVSMLNLNRMAFLASDYGNTDPIVAGKIFSRIEAQWDEGTWKTKEAFDYAEKQAANNAPILAKLRAIEAAADENTKTTAGLRSQASFEGQYKELVRQCVRGNNDVGKFKTLINVGEKGTVEDIRVYWHSAASHCVYEKLQTLKQQKATPFPPLPQTPYWVRFDLDWADVTPVAVK